MSDSNDAMNKLIRSQFTRNRVFGGNPPTREERIRSLDEQIEQYQERVDKAIERRDSLLFTEEESESA